MSRDNYETFKRFFASSSSPSSSPFDPQNHSTAGSSDNNARQQEQQQQPKKSRRRKPLKFVPLKPAVDVTPKARKFFIHLLKDPPRPEICGIRLNYGQAKGEPRMVYSFAFVSKDELDDWDEAVPLLIGHETKNDSGGGENYNNNDEEGNERNSSNSKNPILYVSGNAFLKVLGATVDVDKTLSPVLYDKEGNRMDPNA